MINVAEIQSIAGIIQLAVAPVFLLAGISGFVNVMIGRLSRIVDRVRELRSKAHLKKAENAELKILSRRMHLINMASSLCTFAALMVCLVIVVLFMLYFLQIEAAWIIATMFIVTMLSLTVGLLFFQAEIYLATKTMKMLQG